MIPATLGDFTIESLLGEGGSSLVYAARRTNDPTEEIALKVLHPDLGLTERETERFLDEARKLNQLNHPSIVSLRASGRLPDGRPFLAMPRLRGQSLGDRLRGEAIPTSFALALFTDVANAVSALHEAGLLHRDLKPDNVFWLEADDRLVLLDLGIARDTESSPGTTTRAGLSRGTPEYMAPERLFGQRATVKTDVYELSLLLYVMLARRPPWKEGDAHARLEPKIDPDLVAALPPALIKTIEDGLALDVARRPESVRALLDRIEEATRGTNLDAARPSLRTQPTTLRSEAEIPPTRLVLTPRGPVPTESSLATAPTALHTPPSLTPQGTPAPFSAPPTAPSAVLVGSMAPPARRSSFVPIAAGSAIAIAGIAGAFFIARGRARGEETTASSAVPSAALSDAPESATPSASPAPVPASATAEASAIASATIARPASSAPALPPPSTTARASAVPSSVATSAPAPSSPGGSNAMPPVCSQLIALVCSPTSGARPEECSAWTGNVHHWVDSLPPDVARQTCEAAYTQEKAGLALRKSSPPP